MPAPSPPLFCLQRGAAWSPTCSSSQLSSASKPTGGAYPESHSSPAPIMTPGKGRPWLLPLGLSTKELAALPKQGLPSPGMELPGWQGSQKAGLGTCIYLQVAPGPWGQRAGTLREPIRSSVCSAPPRPWQCRSHRCHGMPGTVSLHGYWPPRGQHIEGRVSKQAGGQQGWPEVRAGRRGMGGSQESVRGEEGRKG